MRLLMSVPVIILLCSCGANPSPQAETPDQVNSVENKTTYTFNEESAYAHISRQVEFGPRVPGSEAHRKCHEYMVSVLRPLADTVYLQNSTARTFDGKTIPVMNIIASFHPSAEKRILLCAHWDTRPFADEDSRDKDKPIPGANDGASGTGVLLAMAEVLKDLPEQTGVDIILFDAEDWGDPSGRTADSYCLGSQQWGRNPHVKGYRADFGILLDMVGAPNAMFGFEGYSLEKAQPWLSLVWSAAASAGYDHYFRNFQRGYVTDDHFYVMELTGIPVIDIIDYDPSTESRFGKYWHTHADNMNAIDKKTLKAVGQTLLNVVMSH